MNTEYEKALQYCLNGEAVLMTGAGFSYEIKNNNGEFLGDAKDLVKRLCEKYNVPYESNYSLDDVATHILEEAKKEANYATSQSLIKLLQDHFQTTSKNINDEHTTIAKINWLRVYTTNYDDVFENAYSKTLGRDIATFNAYDDTSKVAKQKSVVHLNGYIRNLTVEKLNSEFKLTTFSYWQDEFKREKMFKLLKQDLDNAKAIIYIGTSLKYDFDISKILNTDSYKSKTIFIDRETDHFDISDSRKSHLGTQIKKGVKGFATDLISAEEKFIPNANQFEWNCFKPITVNKNIYTDNDLQYLWDLLVLGKINLDILQKNLLNNDYIVSRDELSKIIPQTYKVINLHSNLGNGKTTSVLKQAYLWSQQYRVFILKRNNHNINSDLTELSKIKDHKILIIEDYTYYQDVLKKIKIYLDNSYTLLFTSRSFVNEQFEKQITPLLEINHKDIKHINLNYLSSNEIKNVSSLLRKLNLDGMVNENENRIRKIIGGNNQLSNILLDLLNSEPISREIDKIYEKIEVNNKALQILCATMINSFIPLELTPTDLFSLVDVTTNDIENIRNEDIKEILNIGNGDLSLQSSVFARYLVSRKPLDSKLIETMKKILTTASLLSKEDEKRICNKLISQSNIRVVLAGLEANKESMNVSQKVVRYFDDIVDYRNHKINIFFWLQYGMACMDINRYDRAKNYLDISYSLGEERKKSAGFFETFQIDTQYARLLLENNISSIQPLEGSFIEFWEANNKLEKAIKQKPTQARLAYKQMILYKEYIHKNLKFFSFEEIKKTDSIVNNHLKNKWFLSDKRENNEVKRALESCKQEILMFAVEL
ncbi:SIR2 family protein [Sporosarcina psychrophila]|uniref:SIR2 family protein n=1 Tax=Sporosarcina psychrophila TaxID=1476 RepID=UPI0030CDC3F6